MTVQALLTSAPSTEITEWVAFFRLEDERRKQAEQEAKAEATSRKWHPNRGR